MRPQLALVVGTGAATRNSQPTLAAGAPPKLNKAPAGFGVGKNEPAAVVWNMASVDEPTSGGSKSPTPMLSIWARVAPVAPMLLSKVRPAQNGPPGIENDAGLSNPV